MGEQMFTSHRNQMVNALEKPKAPAVQLFWENQPKAQQPAAPLRRDLNAMYVDHRRVRPLIKCFKCRKLGHVARNCKIRLDVQNMTFEKISEFFWKEEEKARKKDFLSKDK